MQSIGITSMETSAAFAGWTQAIAATANQGFTATANQGVGAGPTAEAESETDAGTVYNYV